MAYAQNLVPDFAGTSDATVQTWLDLAIAHLEASVFGAYYADAVVYYAAHFYVWVGGGGNQGTVGIDGGPVLSMSDRKWSVSKGVPESGKLAGTGDSALGETRYGRMYLLIRRMAGVGSAQGLPP